MIYLDTESVGLVGPTVLIQWAKGEDGEIHLHHLFEEPISHTLKLIESFVEDTDGVCGFNLTHDWFHLQRLYNVCLLLRSSGSNKLSVSGWNRTLREAVHGPCLKPITVLDLFLYARQGPMQSLMERDDVRIRRVPLALAQPLADQLTVKLDLPAIYFARRKEGGQWAVETDPDDPEFPDIKLMFGARGGLKPLARHLLGAEGLDFPIPEQYKPSEDVWNPFQEQPDWLVYYHVAFWQKEPMAQRYAREDIEHLRGLRRVWSYPKPGDTNSLLACLVGSCRWRGWSLDRSALEVALSKAARESVLAPTAPAEVVAGLKKRCGEVEKLVIQDSTADTLDEIIKWGENHEAAQFAKKVQLARSSEKRLDVCRKLLITGRAHFDFKVIGTLSNRMAGSSKLNPQGVDGQLREIFTLSDSALPEADGGDFDQFEVALACAAYNDPQLTIDLKSGKKLHGIFGEEIFGIDYETVIRSSKKDEQALRDYLNGKGLGWEGDLYKAAKGGVFTLIYGGEAPKLAETMGITIERAEQGRTNMLSRYPGMMEAQSRVEKRFCAMQQPGGLGTKVYWHEPADYIESLFGFKRYFTLENQMCRVLFELAENPTEELKAIGKGLKVRRRDRLQTGEGALRSALFGAAFQMQARNMRAAKNHEIQSSGAHITKELQLAIWHLQPAGVHPWVVQPWNIHDEVECARQANVDLEPTVSSVVERFKERVPLLGMTWKKNIPNWGALK